MIDPSLNIDETVDILVENGRIAGRFHTGGHHVSPFADRTLNASGFIVSPGFVDIHAHLRFPGQKAKESIASGTSAAIRGGFTTVCTMANTKPSIDSAAKVEQVLQVAAAEAKCRINVIGAVSKGLSGQINTNGPELVSEGVVALSDDGKAVLDREVMKRALAQSAKLGVAVSAHEESHEPGAPSDPCWPCTGESAMVKRDIELMGETGGKLHIAHVSCAESVELIAEAQAAGHSITAEATPHHLALTSEELSDSPSLPPRHGFAKVNPPLRSQRDVLAIREGLATGVISAIATDHAPHTSTEKCGGLQGAAFGFTAFELALPLVLRLVASGALSMVSAVQRLTSGPAQILGLSAGTLRTGAVADICLFDPKASWQPGRDSLVSKSENTPLLGQQLLGRVYATVAQGRLYQFGEDHGLRAFRAP